jgi:hypothetical protein
LGGTDTAAAVGRHVVAALALGAVAFASVALIDVTGTVGAALDVAVATVAGGIAYVVVLALTGSHDLRWVIDRLRRRDQSLDVLSGSDEASG